MRLVEGAEGGPHTEHALHLQGLQVVECMCQGLQYEWGQLLHCAQGASLLTRSCTARVADRMKAAGGCCRQKEAP